MKKHQQKQTSQSNTTINQKESGYRPKGEIHEQVVSKIKEDTQELARKAARDIISSRVSYSRQETSRNCIVYGQQAPADDKINNSSKKP